MDGSARITICESRMTSPPLGWTRLKERPMPSRILIGAGTDLGWGVEEDDPTDAATHQEGSARSGTPVLPEASPKDNGEGRPETDTLTVSSRTTPRNKNTGKTSPLSLNDAGQYLGVDRALRRSGRGCAGVGRNAEARNPRRDGES